MSDISQSGTQIIDDVEVIKKVLQHLDLWETRNHGQLPGKIMLEFMPENALHPEQLTIAGSLQYPDLDSN